MVSFPVLKQSINSLSIVPFFCFKMFLLFYVSIISYQLRILCVINLPVNELIFFTRLDMIRYYMQNLDIKTPALNIHAYLCLKKGFFLKGGTIYWREIKVLFFLQVREEG